MRLSKRAKRRLIILLAAILVVCAGAVGVKTIRAAQQRRLVAEAHEKGAKAYEQGDLETALIELNTYVVHKRDEPETIDEMIMLADTRRRLPLPNGQHLAEAMHRYEYIRRLLGQYPDLSDHAELLRQTRMALLELYGELGMRVELIETADRILDMEPDNANALAGRVRSLFVDRRFDEAMKDVHRLVEIEPANPAWRHLQLQVMRGLGRSDDSLMAQCDAWIADWDGDGRLHLLKAGWLAEMGLFDQAEREAELAARRGADALDVLQKIVTLLDLLQLRETASKVLTDAESRFPDEQWVAEATVRRLWQAGRIHEAIAEIAEAEQKFTVLEGGLLRLKVALSISTQRLDDAELTLKAMRQAAGQDETGRRDRAWADAVQARIDLSTETLRDAISAYHAALAGSPEDAMLCFLLGEAHSMAGERALAIDAYRQAFALEPNWRAAGIALAEALLAAGRPHEALQTTRILLGQDREGHLAIYLLLARSYLASLQAGGDPVIIDRSSGWPIDIVQLITSMHEQLPDRSDVAVLLARAYWTTGSEREADDFLHRMLTSDAIETETLLALAAVYQQHDLDAAENLIDKARRSSGLTVDVAMAQAELRAAQGRFDDALSLIDEAIAIAAADDPQREAAIRRTRCTCMLHMDHDEAMQCLHALLTESPRSAETYNFVLAQPAAWDNADLVRQVIEGLADLLGERSPQVRMAQANELLCFHGDDESQRAKAIVMISGVLEQSPNSLPALLLMAQASMGGEHPSIERAIEHLVRAVSIAPGRSELHVQLISLLQRQGNYEQADRYLKQLSRLAEHDRNVMRSELSLLSVQGDFETALLAAGRLADETAAVSDQLVLAALHERAGDRTAAEEIYQQLLASPNHTDLAVAQAAEFYANTGRFQRGVELLQTVALDGGAGKRAMLLGMFFQRHGRTPEAETWFQHALEEEPDSAEAHHRLARLYLAEHDHERAKRHAMDGLRIDPEHAGLRAALAMANMGLSPGDRAEAIRLLREIGGENDSLLATLTLLEQVPVENGAATPTEANLARARRLIEEHGRFLPAWMLAMSLHREAGRVRETIDLARRAVSRFPANPEPSEWATQLLIRYGRWDEALVEAREWRRRRMHDPEPADLALASIMLQLGRPADSVEQLAPHSGGFIAQRVAAPDRLALWLRALVLSGQEARAWDTVASLLDEDARWTQLWIGLSQVAAGDVASAMLGRLETQADRLTPQMRFQTAQALSELGRRFERPGCFDRALSLIDETGGDADLQAAGLFLRARIAEGRGDLPLAESLYRQVLGQQPDSAAALNNLAYVLAKMSQRCDEALSLAEEALRLQPDQPDLLDTYAHVLRCLGRMEDAREALGSALRQRPEDIPLSLSLAELFIDMNALDEAEEVLFIVQDRFDALTIQEPALERRIEAAQRLLHQTRASAGP